MKAPWIRLSFDGNIYSIGEPAPLENLPLDIYLEREPDGVWRAPQEELDRVVRLKRVARLRNSPPQKFDQFF